MLTVIEILLLLLQVAWWFVIVHVILSWLINFGVLNVRQPIVAQVWDGLTRLLEPVYARIRSVLPATGGLDLAPLVAILGIIVARMVLTNAAVSVAS